MAESTTPTSELASSSRSDVYSSTGNTSPDAASREIEESEALAFWLSHRHCVIVWRDGPQRLQPADPAKRIRDLRPGDTVLWEEEKSEVLGMSVYR